MAPKTIFSWPEVRLPLIHWTIVSRWTFDVDLVNWVFISSGIDTKIMDSSSQFRSAIVITDYKELVEFLLYKEGLNTNDRFPCVIC